MNEDIQKLIDVSVALGRQQCAHDYLKIMRDAVKQARLEEREKCAKECESIGQHKLITLCAAAIRGRTE